MSQPTLVFAGSLGPVGIADEPRTVERPAPNKGERSVDRPNSKPYRETAKPTTHPGEPAVRVR